MSVDPQGVLQRRKSDLLDGMREYMHEVDVSYVESDVQRCDEILERFSAAITTASGRTEALEHVRRAVLDLNALNSSCEGDLIETDQREMICEFIIKTCALRGFLSENEDVTLEWREW